MSRSSAAAGAPGSFVKSLVAVLVIVAAIWMIWTRSNRGPDEIGHSRAETPEVEVVGSVSDAAHDDRDLPVTRRQVETSKVFASKDPFEPLVETESVAVDDTLTTGTASTERSSTGASRGDHSSKSDGGESQTTAGATVEVVEVADDASVRVRIDDTTYKPRRGQVFASNFKLLSVEHECTTMLYGDEQFTLCVGEHVIK
jgi:hypothetical protein